MMRNDVKWGNDHVEYGNLVKCLQHDKIIRLNTPNYDSHVIVSTYHCVIQQLNNVVFFFI